MKTQKTTESSRERELYKDVACDIRLKEGGNIVESGEFAETQVQHPPDQISSIPRTYRANGPSSRKA